MQKIEKDYNWQISFQDVPSTTALLNTMWHHIYYSNYVEHIAQWDNPELP